MSDDNQQWIDKKITRRDFLKKAGIAGAGTIVGGSVVGAVLGSKNHSLANEIDGGNEYSLYGKHQSGITTPAQSHVYLMVVDLHSTDIKEVKKMFKDWTEYSEKLMSGKLVGEELENGLLPPLDTGEVMGMNPYNLTLTFGISTSFLSKLNLNAKKPAEFKDLPHFPRDQIKEKYSGGDICIQACANDAQVAFHAVRNLVRKARNTVTMRWGQSGFTKGKKNETPRNLFGFKDGTANVSTEEKYKQIIWRDKNDWLKDGTYMVVRKIQMHLETWDRTSLQEQENTFGRYKESGAPFGESDEFATVDITKKDKNGNFVIPEDSHVHLAKKAKKEIFRRGYSFSDGLIEETGQFDSGLLFISFQKDPKQFVDVQNSLGSEDKMNEYITHIGSGLFACFPGVKKGEYIGKNLFE
ncbi:deferrochelatase/peroxidase EfeB [Actinomyces sp. zg-332]|uniref:iron uptake transporter deferrochelatase/peroxidase subunit n=1 Tax=Actinomyces sp. zg-332 TaxID=2708340 RepID=UPI00141ED829|nr:iron uptake transporter deferrochelatase/peroxidase subunit [Actinomyces sp. zg-332]QPK93594.1 deferrochelatase/peroxidase EfeB [Actinomyces sp. zg-332]